MSNTSYPFCTPMPPWNTLSKIHVEQTAEVQIRHKKNEDLYNMHKDRVCEWVFDGIKKSKKIISAVNWFSST